MAAEICWALAVAAVLNLDRLALGQNAICRPLVIGLVVGLIFSQVRLGLTLGLWSEVLWLARPPLGGAIIPNGGLAVSTALAGIVGSLSFIGDIEHNSKPLTVLAMALVPPLAHFLTMVEPTTRFWGRKAHESLNRDLNADLQPNLFSCNLVALLLAFLTAFVLSFIGAAVVSLVMVLTLSYFPPSFWMALEKLEKLVPLLCLTFMGMGLRRRKIGLYACMTLFLLVIVTIFSFLL
jgi:mannose/fructose/N-acetylgalactosamine-specific phosphotransferase system component IIC